MKYALRLALLPLLASAIPVQANTLNYAYGQTYARYLAYNFLYGTEGSDEINVNIGPVSTVAVLDIQDSISNLDVMLYSRHGLQASDSGGSFTVDRRARLALGPVDPDQDPDFPNDYDYLEGSIDGPWDFDGEWEIDTAGFAIVTYAFDADPLLGFELATSVSGGPADRALLSGVGRRIIALTPGDYFNLTVSSFFGEDLAPGGSIEAYGQGRLSLRFASEVPEPATWTMLIAGFGLVGGALRSRPKAAGASAQR